MLQGKHIFYYRCYNGSSAESKVSPKLYSLTALKSSFRDVRTESTFNPGALLTYWLREDEYFVVILVPFSLDIRKSKHNIIATDTNMQNELLRRQYNTLLKMLTQTVLFKLNKVIGYRQSTKFNATPFHIIYSFMCFINNDLKEKNRYVMSQLKQDDVCISRWSADLWSD